MQGKIMALTAPGQLNVNESPSWGSRSVDCFEKLEQIGEGTYGYANCAFKYSLSDDIIIILRTKMFNHQKTQKNNNLWAGIEETSFLKIIKRSPPIVKYHKKTIIMLVIYN